jgi:hypothetical protein
MQLMEARLAEVREQSLNPSIRYRDNAHYDILSNLPLYAEHNAELRDIDSERKARFMAGYMQHELETKLHKQDLIMDKRSDSRRLNRISYDRFSGIIDRGHDIVNNRDLSGRYSPYPKGPRSVWEILNQKSTR